MKFFEFKLLNCHPNTTFITLFYHCITNLYSWLRQEEMSQCERGIVKIIERII